MMMTVTLYTDIFYHKLNKTRNNWENVSWHYIIPCHEISPFPLFKGLIGGRERDRGLRRERERDRGVRVE